MHWTLPALTLIATTAVSVQMSRAHAHVIEHIDRQINHIKRVIRMSTQDAINAVVDQLRKAQTEITTELASVQAQLEAAGVAEQVDLSALTAAAQALDDIVADAPAEPVDPAPVEPAAPTE